jgi:hypothetical protein
MKPGSISGPQSVPLGSRPVNDETIRGVAPTRTVGETRAKAPVSKLGDLSRLFKVRVTSLVVMTAWAAYFLAARKLGANVWSWKMLGTMAGIGLVGRRLSAEPSD